MKTKTSKARVNPLLGLSALALAMAIFAPAWAKSTAFNVPSEQAAESIPEFARQAGIEIVMPGSETLRGIRTTAVEGNLEPRNALARLLAGTGLEIASDDGRVITLRLASNAGTDASTPSDEDTKAPSQAIAEILVRGNRTLNTDILRSRDDIQPYVVFDAEQISRSGAQNLEDFLQAQLPMNAQQQTISQLGPQTSPRGRIDLRGLGADQTLILVDGRRLPSISTGDSFGQPNINGISVSQIERIEILPATSGGIYGGGATGGVINIILKRNFSGIDLDASYGNAFDTNVGEFRVGINGGFSLEDGRTHVLFNASHSEARTLLSSDRSFFRRGAEMQLRNDPTHASALFGGANLCSTEDGFTCSAQPLSLKGGSALSSSFTSVPDGYAGPSTDGGAALAGNAGTLQFDRAGVPIWSAPDITAYSLNVRRKFTDHIELFADFSRDVSKTVVNMPAQRLQYVPASSSDNPFEQDILSYVSIPDLIRQSQRITNTRVNVGSIIRLPLQWSAALEYGWLRNTTRSSNGTVLDAASPEADAILQAASFRDIIASPLTDPRSLFTFFDQSGRNGDTLQTVSLRMSGPIVKLPGGDLTATALLEGRNESSDSTINATSFFGFESFFWTPKAKRNIRSAYLELRAPIISSDNTLPFVDSLELMASARHDSYRTSFSGSSIDVDGPDGPFPDTTPSTNKVSSTSYTLGLRYAPTPDLALRASYGTGFLPANLAQIRGEAPATFSPFLIFLLDLRDPARGSELIPGPLTVLSGGSPNLKPERSESSSLGLVLTPRIAPGLRISIDYTNIHKTNEISTLPLAFFIDNPDALAGRVVRGPNLPGDSPGTPGPITQIDISSLNLASSRLRAIDIQADYKFSTNGLGDWRFYVVATNTLELSRRVLPTEAKIDRVDFADGPLKWRGNLGIDWSKGSLNAGWNAQYYNSYRVCSSFLSQFVCGEHQTWQGSERIPSQIYHDAYIRYSFDTQKGPLAHTKITFGINNIFNRKGATIASGVANSNGPTSYVDPRLRRFTVALNKNF